LFSGNVEEGKFESKTRNVGEIKNIGELALVSWAIIMKN
jgi:hypothetical protein